MAKKNYKSPLTWKPQLMAVNKIKPTPNNYKIRTDLGRERLAQSLEAYGLAGTVVVNTDMTLIDGNSRLEQAKERGEKKVWVSIPNRKLTPKEFKEMSAMFDYAKAGEVDMDRIHKDLGTTEDFYGRWKMDMPKHLLDNMGANAPIESVSSSNGNGGKEKPIGVHKDEDEMLINLFFTIKQEKQFRKMEAIIQKKFKTENTTDTVMIAMKKLTKGK